MVVGASVYGNHVILVSPQSRLDLNLDLAFRTAQGLDLGQRGLDLGLGLDNIDHFDLVSMEFIRRSWAHTCQ